MITTPEDYAALLFGWIRNGTEETARVMLAKVVQYAKWYGRTMEIEAALKEIRASLPQPSRRPHLMVVR